MRLYFIESNSGMTSRVVSKRVYYTYTYYPWAIVLAGVAAAYFTRDANIGAGGIILAILGVGIAIARKL